MIVFNSFHIFMCMETTYCIYKITNTVNNKIYIGKTKRRLCNRMSDHRYFAKKGSSSPISRAISKYGWENFTVEVIETCASEEDMNQKEVDVILECKSTDPMIGYNVCSEKQDHRFSNSDYYSKIQKHAVQGRKNESVSKYSKYVGTRLWDDKWYCQCFVDGKSISKRCEDETKAAELYDKISMYHYGEKCKLNFENMREKYKKEDLKSVFDSFIDITHSSKEPNVCYDKSRNSWVFSKTVNGKKIFKRFETEKQAIEYKNTNAI